MYEQNVEVCFFHWQCLCRVNALDSHAKVPCSNPDQDIVISQGYPPILHENVRIVHRNFEEFFVPRSLESSEI
jgi:hypothetical protein